jgi:ribosomal RNA-processing protein 8
MKYLQKYQKKLTDKLKGGQFRWINERLYTCKSTEAVNLFESDPKLFEVYHEGFHSQVQQWPENPVDVMIEYIRRQDEQMVVADFGCGDAKLAAGVRQKVHSFDLVAVNERVTACDMRSVPLTNQSVDIVVFCLSLMGTNLVDFLKEANRVLKLSGTLKIAEVKSRFEDVHEFSKSVCSIGFSLIAQDEANKMFLLLEFKKTEEAPKFIKTLSDITLNPCIYKRR